MKSKRAILMIINLVIFIIPTVFSTRSDHESREFESLIRFLRAVDPENVLQLGQGMFTRQQRNPCLLLDDHKLKNIVKCNSNSNSVIEIRLDKSNLSGVIDADSLCKLSRLRVLSLAENRIRGSIPYSMVGCKNLVHLNLSNNLLGGMFPSWLRYIKKLDISKNHFAGLVSKSLKARVLQESTEQGNARSNSNTWTILILVFLAFGFVLLLGYLLGKKLSTLSKNNAISKSLEKDTLAKTPLDKPTKEVPNEASDLESGSKSGLVFFVEEEERFELEDLLEATADLRSHSLCGTLYKVRLKNGQLYAVKRLKKLRISDDEFAKIMREIGALRHDNILPLVAFCSTPEDKLLIYKYQNKGSLLNLLEDYIEGKREFQWGVRISIARGIARGLNFIYENPNGQKTTIPHGNIKLSNILLDDNEAPLISEFGLSKFIDSPNGIGLSSTKGYIAPEKGVTEKSDVFSFGVILLELLTGKLVEKTGVDLPKWVNAMIREEWTGEVFDKNLPKSLTYLAFPLLNVALKCVSYFPENRPTFSEVLERIDEFVDAEDDHDMSTMSSTNDCHQHCCHLHNIIPETWDTPGSNY